MPRLTGPLSLQIDVERHLRSIPDIHEKTVVDVPAGDGRTSAVLKELGAEVIPCDLFPEFFDVEGLACRKGDLMATLPIPRASADVLICQEGIEHLPDQLHAFQQFNHVLKTDGRLLVTTPNISNLRAKLGFLCNEAEVFSRLPATETDAIWFGNDSADEVYFGHVFLAGVQRLRVLGRIAGFELQRVLSTKISWGCVALGGLLPLIATTNLYAHWRSQRRLHKDIEKDWAHSVHSEVIKLNLHPNVLFCKQLFLEFTKTRQSSEVGRELHKKLKAA
jgi:SAM-dependent methyltransferase